MPRANRFTIYDALEKSGYFDKNPANTFARDATTGATLFKGPVEYPKMMYHPLGETRVIVAAEVITTPLGAKEVGEQREMLYQIVRRMWRFGQKNPVHVHVITGELEGAVVRNIERKERQAAKMAEAMLGHMREINTAEIHGTVREQERYHGSKRVEIPAWL